MWSPYEAVIIYSLTCAGLTSPQDPLDPAKTVIVIRSLVPNGVAEKDGRLLPGDRLMYVNTTNLENASLEDAVQALKGAKLGKVQIGVAKPLPVRIVIRKRLLFPPSTLNRFENQSSNVFCVIVVLSVRVPVRVTEIYSVLLWIFCSICQGSVPLRMQGFKSSSPYITQVSLQSWQLSLQGLEFFMQETVWR